MPRRLGPLLLAVIFTTGATPTRANLGETLAQCTARYGPPTTEKVGDAEPTRPAEKEIIFKANGCRVIISFLHDIAGTEGFIKIDQTDFTDREIADLLHVESDGLTWTLGRAPWIKPNSLSPVIDYWTRSDGATASYAPGHHGRSGFVFVSQAYDNALNPGPHTFKAP